MLLLSYGRCSRGIACAAHCSLCAWEVAYPAKLISRPAHSIPDPTATSSPAGAPPPRHGPGSGAADPRYHRLPRGHLRLHPLRLLRHQRRPPRRRRARPRPLLLRRHPAPRQPPRVPHQRRHGDARRPARVGRVLFQRGRLERGLPRDQRILRRHGHHRGRNRG